MRYKVVGIGSKIKAKSPYDFDCAMRNQYGDILVGIDEVGRGAVAGPIVAAAVALKPDTPIAKLTDSKKLTEERRKELVPIIKEAALAYSIQRIEAEEIDEKGLTWANQQVMYRAACDVRDQLGEINLYIIDQSPQFKLKPHLMFPKADGKSLVVAAASVLAKVWRDEYMVELSKQYPDYGWDESKGYINTFHKEAINKYGKIKGIHRFSYNLNLEV